MDSLETTTKPLKANEIITTQSKPYQLYTFGCKVNTYDSGLMEKNLQRWGFNDQWRRQNIHILNTCAVTAEATKEAVKSIRRLKAKDPFCTVVVTGCSAQVDTQVYEKLPGADLVIANSHKAFLPEIIEKYLKGEVKEKVFKSNIFRKEDLEAGGGQESQHTRAFLKIQDGCNSFCSYCIIPYARGKSRSLPVDVLVSRIKELEKAGYQEVVLTGVHIGDYQDISLSSSASSTSINASTVPSPRSSTTTTTTSTSSSSSSVGLEDLIETILEKTQIPRLRLTSLEPVELTDRLLDLYQNKRLTPHFHMSIQSAEDQVLKDMKRHYQAQDVRESLLKIQEKVPGAFVGMDVIVGFPTESEESFQKTFELLQSTPWTRLHVFPYSERSGTRAAQMSETVPMRERQRRSEFLRHLSWSRLQAEAEKQKKSIKQVLILKNKDGVLQGLSRDYWSVDLPVDMQVDLHSDSELDLGVEAGLKENQSQNFLGASSEASLGSPLEIKEASKKTRLSSLKVGDEISVQIKAWERSSLSSFDVRLIGELVASSETSFLGAPLVGESETCNK